MSDNPNSESFSAWLREPQTLIALSAVLLSLCGLFVSIYEASLIRQQQRGMVWPHLNVGAGFSGDGVAFHVENSGVGPARIRAASLLHEEDVVPNWVALVQRLDAPGSLSDSSFSVYRDLVSHRVLSPGSALTMFRLQPEDEGGGEAVVRRIQSEIADGSIDVVLCYCSVYETCWTASMQGALFGRSTDADGEALGEETMRGTRRVENCEGIENSNI